MRYDSGSLAVSSPTQLSNTNDRVLWLRVHNRAGNGTAFLGRSDVTTTNGRQIDAGEAVEVDFRIGEKPGSEVFSAFFVETTTDTNVIDWEVILAS